MKGVCVLEGMCCMHDSWGPREKGEWRKRNREWDSFKGEHCWFFAPLSRDLGGRVEGEARGESFLCSLLCFCTPTPLLYSFSPQHPQNPSWGQPPAPSNEAPGSFTAGGLVWHALAFASPTHYSCMARAPHTPTQTHTHTPTRRSKDLCFHHLKLICPMMNQSVQSTSLSLQC